MSISGISAWDVFSAIGVESGLKNRFYAQKRVLLCWADHTTVCFSARPRVVFLFLSTRPCTLSARLCVPWECLNSRIFRILRSQMHLYKSQMPKPIWLMCNWTCMSGLTYLCFENEMILRNGENRRTLKKNRRALSNYDLC